MFAISYDAQDTLSEFAEQHGITYPLLSDVDSRVIREFGILNTHMPEDHKRFGVPYPGTYIVGRDGLVIDKAFFAEHRTRESVNDMLQEGLGVEGSERSDAHVVTTPHLSARAYFASTTVRSRQFNVLTVELSLADLVHVNGHSAPEGYVPLDLEVDGGDNLRLDRVDYPEPEEMVFEFLGEKLPVHTGRLKIKARCIGLDKREDEPFQVEVRLRYQACDDTQCYLPQTITFCLPLRFLPHVR